MTEHTAIKTTPNPGEILISAEEIAEVVARLGAAITADYTDKNPMSGQLCSRGASSSWPISSARSPSRTRSIS